MGSMKRRIRRLEDRMDTTDHEAEARRRAKVRAELKEFEARRRGVSNAEMEAWRNSPEGQEWRRKLEEAIQRKRLGGPKRGPVSYK
jgi:septal ring factor EnvC (AmiA/AmiB activator)